MTVKREGPGGNRGHARADGLGAWQVYRDPKRGALLPYNWRDRLPGPDAYYPLWVAKLGKPNAGGWAQGTCPFHDDRNASLSVQVRDPRGGWRCFYGCGSGDLLHFHMRFTSKPFKDAVIDLMGLWA